MADAHDEERVDDAGGQYLVRAQLCRAAGLDGPDVCWEGNRSLGVRGAVAWSGYLGGEGGRVVQPTHTDGARTDDCQRRHDSHGGSTPLAGISAWNHPCPVVWRAQWGRDRADLPLAAVASRPGHSDVTFLTHTRILVPTRSLHTERAWVGDRRLVTAVCAGFVGLRYEVCH